MDEENSVVEADDKQADMLDKVAGKKIWNIELLEDEDGSQSLIKILFSEGEDDCLMIHCEGADIYLLEPKPKSLH